MKKLFLLMFAILILGCGNENPLLEENKALIEQNGAAIEMLSQLVQANENEPKILQSNVSDGHIVDPETYNRDGIWVGFTERISAAQIDLRLKDGPSLNWIVDWIPNRSWVELTPPHACATLLHNSTYVVDMIIQDYDCQVSEISLTFRTKPKPVGTAPSVDIIEPMLRSTNLPGDPVDPNPLNRDGLWFEFNEPIATSQIDLRLKDGPSLGWVVQWSADQRTVTLTSPNLCSILIHDRTYVIAMVVRDYDCWASEIDATFTTTKE